MSLTATASPMRAQHYERALSTEARLFYRTIVLLIGALHIFAARHTITTDGIGYFDVGDALMRGDWTLAINATWSPLYPWLQGFVRWLVEPDVTHEFALAHLVNFGIFMAGLFSLEYLLSGWMQYLRLRVAGPVHAHAWSALAYGVFLVGTLELIEVSLVLMDLTFCVFVLLAAGVLVRLHNGEQSQRNYVLLGLVLGFGCLAKAPTYVVSFAVLLYVLGARVAPLSVRVRGAMLSTAIMLSICGPYVAALSYKTGRFTFSDNGWLNYGWYVNGAAYRHWQGGQPDTPEQIVKQRHIVPMDTGTPVRATRRAEGSIPVYEFGRPLTCTYAVWCEPSYWYEGMKTKVHPWQQLNRVWVGFKFMKGHVANLHPMQMLQSDRLPFLFTTFLLGYWLWLAKRGGLQRYGGLLVAVAMSGLAVQIAIYIEKRHLGAMLVPMFLGLFGFVKLDRHSPRVILAALVLLLLPSQMQHVASAMESLRQDAPKEWTVASQMKRAGLKPGDTVASLAYSNPLHAKWARLARVRIVAEVYTDAFDLSESVFWDAPATERDKAIAAFRASGAAAVISRRAPDWAESAGWKKVGDTGYSMLPLRELTAQAQSDLP